MSLTLESGERYVVAQIAGEELIFDDPVDLPPCRGEFSLSIDRVDEQWEVELPDGARREVARTRFLAV